MKLADLFKSVQEVNLTKTQLENYHTELTSLFAAMHLELAEIEKKEALFILASELKTSAAKKEAWRGTELGQRDIELTHYARATEKVLSSLKNRMYGTY